MVTKMGLATLLALLVVVFAGCSKKSGETRKTVELAFYWTCNAHGRLEPCGCFTGQNGGLTRIKTFLESPDAVAEHLLVDVGNAIAGTEDYQIIQYHYMQQGFAATHYVALNMGEGEAQLSAAALKKLRGSSPLAMISANLIERSSGQRIFPAYHLVEEQGYRIAFLGVLGEVPEENLGADLVVEPMKSALAKILPEIKQKADFIVLLAYADEAAMRDLADEFYELDVILGGKVKEPSQAFTRQNRSVVLWTTNETKALGMLAAEIGGPRKMLAKAYNIFFINDKIPQDEHLVQLSQTYRDEIRKTSLAVDDPAQAHADEVPGVKPSAGYVGSESCAACHAGAYKIWRGSKHAQAFQSLVDRKSDADPNCIGCHAIGFGTTTGYRREFQGKQLTDVGCESCHGPGSEHVNETTRQRLVPGDKLLFKYRPVGTADCASCHYGEFSRPFDWASFWPQIRHGKEVVALPAKVLSARATFSH